MQDAGRDEAPRRGDQRSTACRRHAVGKRDQAQLAVARDLEGAMG